jgi:ketosteroid isomerase-like protein
MYRAIVEARTRGVWSRIDAHDAEAPWKMAAPDMRFTFVGDSPLAAEFSGRDRFRTWLDGVFSRFPDLRFVVSDVLVKGWPWRTRVAVRLEVSATLKDGSKYKNHATQWLTLQWGRMTEDWVLEDTVTLSRACAIQDQAVAQGVG